MHIYPLGQHQKEKITQELGALRNYRDNYLDDLPKRILKPEDPNYDRYKCRVNFFGMLSLKISMLIDRWFIENNWSFDEFFKYIDYRHELTTSDTQVKTTAKDIVLINNTIQKAILLLESTPNN